jgi:hypothetical protein
MTSNCTSAIADPKSSTAGSIEYCCPVIVASVFAVEPRWRRITFDPDHRDRWQPYGRGFRSRYSIRLRRFVHERHEAICGYLRGTRTPQRYATSDV